ncbi:MAG: HTTM domain-containing protein [Planctomycetes bacterium]|nr:HTTM domain-containing protein [Planctomycetota bacterium]
MSSSPAPPTDASAAPTEPGLLQRLFTPVDGSSLVAFRLIFGGCMLFEHMKYWLKGYHQHALIDPIFHFSFYGFSWVKELPEPAMNAVFVAIALSSFCVMVGAFYRIAAAVLFVTFSYTFLLEATAYRNHVYLLSLLSFMMIFLPAHRAFSVDARRNPELKSQVIPVWPVWLLRFQIGVVYFFAGVAKFDPDWIAGRAIESIFRAGDHSPEVLTFLLQTPVKFFFVWSGMCFDLFVPFLLLWRRTRPFAYLAVMGFHLTNATFLVDVGIFPWFTLMASSIYFSPSWPRRLIARLDASVRRSPPELEGARPPTSLTGLQKSIVAVLLVHVAFQLFMPLRQHLYPGWTSWTHEGHRWAWRMKLVTKDVQTMRFYTLDESGRKIELPVDTIPPSTGRPVRLAPFQTGRVGRQPDLLIQYVHDIAQNLKLTTGKDMPVYADVWVSLNGRPAQQIVDPNVDLSKERATLAHSKWILPYRGE